MPFHALNFCYFAGSKCTFSLQSVNILMVTLQNKMHNTGILLQVACKSAHVSPWVARAAIRTGTGSRQLGNGSMTAMCTGSHACQQAAITLCAAQLSCTEDQQAVDTLPDCVVVLACSPAAAKTVQSLPRPYGWWSLCRLPEACMACLRLRVAQTVQLHMYSS